MRRVRAPVRRCDEGHELDGSALIEALACARPALVTSRFAALEGVGAEMASIVPEDDSSALAEGLVALLDRPEQADRLGQRARVWVLANATWDRAAERLLRAMTEATPGRAQAADGRFAAT